ncbi:MAG: hypothetical protein R2724_07160 [Bryobacterales bacterium]
MRRREWMVISLAAAATACGSSEKAEEPEQASKQQPAADVLENRSRTA